MATYFLRVKVISRGKGGRITRSAAYRAGERLRDERTSEVYNYAHRKDVPYKEIVLPTQFSGRADMDWARDRATLWNAAEHAGKDRHSRLGREVLVILPHELGVEQRVGLARRFAQELADRYGGAVDLAVHEPRLGADERHHHAHLLMTHREVNPEGLGQRTTLELSGQERHARGLGPSREELFHIRERWGEITNAALRAAGINARIDHRSYKDQGIDREPEPLIPEKVYYAEKKSGKKTRIGEEIRRRHRERVEARRRGPDAIERVIESQREEDRQDAVRHFAQKAKSPKKLRWSMLTRDELNQRRREVSAAKRDGVPRKRRNRVKVDEVNAGPSHRRARESETQKVIDPKEKTARLWLDHFEKRDAAVRGPKQEQAAHKWLQFFEDQDAAKAAHPKNAHAQGTKHSDPKPESSPTEQVERHGFRRGRTDKGGGHGAGDERNETAANEPDHGRGPDRGPDDQG